MGIGFVQAQEHAEEAHGAREGFNAGDMILDHITDKHYWHICDWKGKPVELHLPVILIHEGKLHVFSSKNFENPHHTYQNFQLRKEAPHKGKIVALTTDASGKTVIADQKPWDFSITKTVFGLMVSTLVILLVFFFIVRSYKKNGERAPRGIAALFEPIFLFVRNDVVFAILGKKHGEKFLPYMATLFFFIVLGNLLGIVPFFPFGANVTGNISVTCTLAFVTYLMAMAYSSKHFWKHTFLNPDVPGWMKFPLPLMPLIEAMELITKPIVLMIRLFANMTAGHIIILGFVSLVLIFGARFGTAWGFIVSPLTVIFGLFADALELLVAFIQAYIFTTLSCTYLADALGGPAEKAAHH